MNTDRIILALELNDELTSDEIKRLAEADPHLIMQLFASGVIETVTGPGAVRWKLRSRR